MLQYGNDNASLISEFKHKRKSTFIRNFNVDNPMKNIQVKDKAMNTNLIKYGVTNLMKIPSIRQERAIKRQITLYKNGNAPCSKQQRHIGNVLGGTINYPICNYALDIAFINDKIYIEYKDRLLRIGFDDFERICKFFGTKIVILDNTDGDKSKQQEITEDLISIIHHFSMRIYSNRKRKKLIDLVQSK